jgi:ketosteroid isomerase-like protein
MKKGKTIIVLAVAAIAAGCAEQPSPAKETAVIKAVLVDMWDAIEKKDINRYAKYVHPDFTQFGETDSILRQGKDAEIFSMKEWFKTTSNVHTEMHTPRVTVKGKTAWIVYYWSDAGLNNGKPFSSRGKSTRIFVRENNQWLCIHGHYTLLP